LARVCEENPDKKVFWTDVDCSLHSLPDYIRDFSADIIGFQRSFGSPLQIGYSRRNRFWEPCFWGINTTPNARKMIADAYRIEQLETEIKATDDFFMEEAWRENADNLSFQLIPSNAIIGKGNPDNHSKEAFFQFGSSGNVAEFKGKVVQHGTGKKLTPKQRMLATARKIESSLPEDLRNRARLMADSSGLTGLLTSGNTVSLHPAQEAAIKKIVRTAQIAGAGEKTEELIAEFEKSFRPRPNERNSFEAARTFAHYANHRQ
jgi:hypothetical protein